MIRIDKNFQANFLSQFHSKFQAIISKKEQIIRR